MSLFLDSATPRNANGTKRPAFQPHRRKMNGPAVRLALVNNMPDSALVATERQFTRLASEALEGALDISLFHIPSLPRGQDAKAILAQNYSPIDEMLDAEFDALIVTGNEPRAAKLDDEPYWPDLVEIVTWAQQNTAISLWSCLAAHGAVLYLDGIERQRLPRKKSGVLSCNVAEPARQGLPASLTVCHSRMNEVRTSDLLARGYEIVSEAAGGHVDVFAKTSGSRFLFLQGHPEYDADSLMREYRRDVGRYLNGNRETYPDVPESYFDSMTTVRMENFRVLAEKSRDMRLFESFPQATLRSGLQRKLADSARDIFSGWMADVGSPAPAT